GRAMVEKWVPRLKSQYKYDALIINGENSANNGKGITPKIADFFLANGAMAITTGNHVWGQKEIQPYIKESQTLLRPANFPSSCPGRGYFLGLVAGQAVAIVNLQGRVFMHEHLDCPFKT